MDSSILARLKGLEPLTYWFVASHSIQLSYKRIWDEKAGAFPSPKSILSQLIGKIKRNFNQKV